MATVTLNKWGGMTNDGNNPSSELCLLSKHFDIQTSPYRLSAHRSSENGYAFQDTARFINFAYGNNTLYALGRSTVEVAAIMGTAAIDNPSWFTPANNTDTGGTRSPQFFMFYHDQLYGASSGVRLWQYDIATTTMNTPWQALTYSSIAQGLIHSQDDILYIPYDNKIASWDGSSFNATALTLPSQYIVSAICEYGNYLAIACRPASGYGNSRVFLWDRNSSLETVSESIDWGEGSIYAIGEVQGTLVGVSTTGSLITPVCKVIFKEYTTSGAVIFQQISTNGAASIVSTQRVNDGLYFLMDATLSDGDRHPGIWSLTGSSGNFSVVHEYLPDNDIALDLGTGLLHGFILLSGYAYIAYENLGTYYLSKTDDQTNYNSTSIRETLANPGMPLVDRERDKQLQAVSLSYPPLPAGASVTLKYLVDGGAWTTIFTETGDGAVNTEMDADATGTPFVGGHDYEFRLESTGGAEISELKYRYDLNDSNI